MTDDRTISTTEGDKQVTKKNLESAWLDWSAAALPPQAPLAQRASMRTAFMCGAACLLSGMTECDTPEKFDAHVAAATEELVQFMAVLHEGMKVRIAHDAAVSGGVH